MIVDEFKSFYKTVGAGEGERCYYPTRLDTYGRGCQHDCKYCYAKSLLSFRHLWNNKHPAVADIEKIERKIKRLDRSNVIRLGGMTDCFMPQERKFRITYETLKILKNYGQPYLIVTKSSLVGEDDYTEALDKDLAHIQISFSSMDQKASNELEHCSSVKERVTALEKLSELGFDTCMRVAPLIPDERYFRKEHAAVINKVKCDKLLVEFLRVNTWIKRWLHIDYTPFTLKEGGYVHLPLKLKLEYLKLFKGKEISVCEDVSKHYNYFKKHYNPNQNDCCNL